MQVTPWTASALSIALLTISCSNVINPAPAPSVAPAQPQSTPVITSATPVPTTQAAGPTSAVPSDAVIAFIVTEKSQARYRVREQLVGVNLPSDAVGATNSISGTIVGKMDGTILPLSKFRVDMRTLVSNEDRRDNFLRQSVLNTRNFPFAEFVPKQVKGLALPPPTSGDVKFQLVGDLTIRDVTKAVTWEVEGKVNGNEGNGIARTNFNFAYFNLTQPRVPMVLSIQDDIRLEVEGILRRQ